MIEAAPHPNADRLKACRVLGADGEVPVVCGAPVVLPGRCYPFAPVGAVLPGGFKIGKRKIRGQVSQGMLCSERELGLGDDQAGIMLMEGDHEAGTPFAEAAGLDDHRLDVEVTPNRGDLLSHVGVARELHPGGEAAIVLPELPELDFARGGAKASNSAARIRIEEPELCSRYLGAVIRGVRVGPSPTWLAGRLRAAGARPINNVVDATNYVLLELGQPLHAFDLDRLAERTIVVGRARPGESLTTLDGEERAVTPDMLTIRDAERPVAIAGVMGGENSEVSEATTDILLECAYFEPRQVRATRRALGMSTDASYRFERGVSPANMETAVRRAVALIVATAGGSLDGEVIDANPAPWTPPVVRLRPSRVERVLGVAFGADEVAGLLAPLGYQAAESDSPPPAADALHFVVPGHRCHDTLREADLIEEVARAHGYDAFPATLSPYKPGTIPDDPLFQLEDRLRERLCALGLSEAQTPALGPARHGDVAVLNPISAEESRLRRDRLPGLLSHLERNLARGVRDVRLFEFGTAFAPGAGGEARPVETTRAAVALHGRRAPLQWSDAGDPVDVHDIARVLEVVGEEAHPGGGVVPARGDAPHLRRRAAYELRDAGGRVVGWAGEVRADEVDLPPWAGTVVGAEVVLPPRPREVAAVTATDLPDQPSSVRDVAFLVPDGAGAGEVLAASRRGGGRLLESADLFDVFEGGDLPPGVRSVAVRLRFRARGRTLTDKEVDRACRRIVATVRKTTGAEARG